MLTIRHEQMQALQDLAMKGFENEMIAHARAFSPRLCSVLDEAEIRRAVAFAIARARAWSFSTRGAIRLFIELALMRGSCFDTDPLCWRIADVLHEGHGEMRRARHLHLLSNTYHETVSGPRAINARRALDRMLLFASEPVPIRRDSFTVDLLRLIHGIYPEKAAYVGDEALRALIGQGSHAAQQHGFGARGAVLFVTLMFAFGHGCCDDPWYPWIARTLTDPRTSGPEARAARLEKKARVWLGHVVAGSLERLSA